MRAPNEVRDCGECPLHQADAATATRREFVRHALSALAALGVTLVLPHEAGAMEVVLARALPSDRRDRATERRFAIPAGDSVTIDRDDQLILARAAGYVFAFALSCPHQNTMLRWDAEALEFRCPKHKSRYRPDGTFIAGRATRSMDRLRIRRDGDAVVVDVDVAYRQDDQLGEWAAAIVPV